MIHTDYDAKTAALIDEVMHLWQTALPGASKPLKALKKEAVTRKDNALLGFVHYHYADLYYYREPDYEKFKKNIGLSIKALMRTDEKELLGRAYNFVAIDAVNHGSYDVAYSYFMTCARICEDIPDSLVTGIAYSNLGQLFNELGYYELARRFVRKGIRIIRKHPEDGKYYRNLVNMTFQDAMISLAMNRFTDVEKALDTIQKLMQKFHEADEGMLSLPLSFLKTRVALGRGNTEEAYLLMDDLIDALVHEPQLYDCIDDVFTFLNYLIDNHYLDLADRIFKAIDEKVANSGVTHIMVMYSEILVSYYEAGGNMRMVTKQLHAQHTLTKALRADQQQIHRFSIDLIRMVSDVQDEQTRMKKENEVLQVQAQTDALTGVPNRHAMNKELVRAFERAYKAKLSLGVAILDIDYFKEYNDTYGHRRGDVCLEIIAKELLVMATDDRIFCARYGGDEFVIIYENMTDEEILATAKKFEAQVASHNIRHEGSSVSSCVTVSQGICTAVPRKKNKLWDYLETADAALYSIKKSRTAHRAGMEHICLQHIPETYRI